MTNLERLSLIDLVAKELHESVRQYEDARRKKGYPPTTGYDIDNFNSKGAIKRRIIFLRGELNQLSKSF